VGGVGWGGVDGSAGSGVRYRVFEVLVFRGCSFGSWGGRGDSLKHGWTEAYRIFFRCCDVRGIRVGQASEHHLT